LAIMHRNGLYMQERMEYRRRIREAVENPKDFLSIIIDGASRLDICFCYYTYIYNDVYIVVVLSNHSTLPYLGQGDTFNNPLKQHIQGKHVLLKGCFINNITI
jgi:hypothetical protein